MESEQIFRIVLGALVVAMYIPRKYYEAQMRGAVGEGLAVDKDTKLSIALQGLTLGVSLWAMIVYLIQPRWMTWSSLSFPAWLRWVGVGLAAVGTVLLIWTHVTLGRNFFGGLKLRAGHELVTNGPFRWVQHPMYVAFIVLGVGYLFLSANWLIGLPWTIGSILIAISRIEREEGMMEEQFGEEYARYRERTGRFFPRLR